MLSWFVFLKYIKSLSDLYWQWDSLVSIVTRLWAAWPRNGLWFTVGREMFLLTVASSQTGTLSASCQRGSSGSFPGDNTPGAETFLYSIQSKPALAHSVFCSGGSGHLLGHTVPGVWNQPIFSVHCKGYSWVELSLHSPVCLCGVVLSYTHRQLCHLLWVYLIMNIIQWTKYWTWLELLGEPHYHLSAPAWTHVLYKFADILHSTVVH
jgi:hypothetical protein